MFSSLKRKGKEKEKTGPKCGKRPKPNPVNAEPDILPESGNDNDKLSDEEQIQMENDLADFEYEEGTLDLQHAEMKLQQNSPLDNDRHPFQVRKKNEKLLDSVGKHSIFQAGNTDVCDLAERIVIKSEDNVDDISALRKSDLVELLSLIQSNETSILRKRAARSKTNQFIIINSEIVSFVRKNCWCLKFK